MLDSFSPRERQIIGELLEARSVKEIATQLHLSVNTVKDYLKTVYQKAEVHSARELLVKLYADREAVPTGEISATQLVASLEKLVSSRYPDDVIDRLLVAARACTTAGRATFWTAVREGTEWLLTSCPGARLRLRLSSLFLQNVAISGFSQLRLDDPMALAERRRLESLGLQWEVLGVRLPLMGRTGILLLTDPQSQRFTPTDITSARVFGRIAETTLQALGAGSVAASAGVGA